MTAEPRHSLDPVAAAEVQSFLRPGEQLLWTGRPRTGLALRGSDLFIVPFGLLFLAGALTWTAMAIRAVCPAIVGIPFIWIGYQIALGRLISDARLRHYTTYALTSHRALVVCLRPGKMEIVRGADLINVARTDLRAHRDGRGSIALSADPLKSPLAAGEFRLWPSEGLEGLFQFVEEPREVARLIRLARRALRTSADASPNAPPAPNAQRHDPMSWFDAGETPLWTGRPRQGFFFRKQDALGIPFSLAWCTVVLFIALKRWTGQDGRHGPITALEMLEFAFMLSVGAFFLIGRFFTDAAERAGTFYAVTSQRVLILRGRRSPYMVSLERDAITNVILTRHRDGAGTLTFNPRKS